MDSDTGNNVSGWTLRACVYALSVRENWVYLPLSVLDSSTHSLMSQCASGLDSGRIIDIGLHLSMLSQNKVVQNCVRLSCC